MKFAMIKNEKVENIAEWNGDESWKAAVEAQGYTIIDVTDVRTCSIGCSYINGEFIKPPEES